MPRYYLRSKADACCSAGNDSMDTSANVNYASMYVVSATDQSDQLTSWSNRGTPTDIAAPGLDILTTNLGGSYAYSSGTSFSAPMVSGAAALVYSVNPNLKGAQVEDILSTTASKTIANYSSATHGAGRLDAAAAVAKAKLSIPKKGRK